MDRNNENSFINEWWSNEKLWPVVGKMLIYTSNTQERLWEVMEGEKYKKHSIDYWLNEVFWLPERQRNLLKTKVDFNEEVSIKDLLGKIGYIGWHLSHERVINLADYSLVLEYMDKFLDYCDDEGYIRKRKVSINNFLKMLSSFEESRIRKG